MKGTQNGMRDVVINMILTKKISKGFNLLDIPKKIRFETLIGFFKFDDKCANLHWIH